ncbi:MAG: type I-MYXAN CRISPR-associated protein Cmx8 [Acidobacteria bacterium]|nr:type I-MYXAN CRISPR-associated protein Cmx8 [Acidobacteriota bacterium]
MATPRSLMRKKRDSYPELLEIEYRLAELPTSQHRAGLAGLVLLADWIKKEYVSRGICDVEISSRNVTFYVDQLGLSELFNGLFAASREEQARPRPMRNLRTGEILPPLREEVRSVIDPVSGLPARTKVCIYETIIPQGAFLADLDPSGDEENGLWIRLWREAVWTTLRAVPATRKPYEARAKDEPVTDSLVVWSELCCGREYAVQVSGTSCLGVQSLSAERVPFMDLAQFRFLLNFWPLVAQIYVPVVYDASDNIDFRGVVVAIPDVRDIDLFSRHFPGMLRARAVAPYPPRQFRPEQAVIDLVPEAGLDLLCRLRTQLNRDTPLAGVAKVVDGVDLFHLERQGNTVQALSIGRVEVDEGLLNRYESLRGAIRSPVFRRQLLNNLIKGEPEWYADFGGLLTREPLARTFSNRHFRHAAATLLMGGFELGGEVGSRGLIEGHIFRQVGEYLNLVTKRAPDGIENTSQNATGSRPARSRAAREAFLAIRARRGPDLAANLNSILRMRGESGANVSQAKIEKLTRENLDTARALTLLALAAQVADDAIVR